MSTSGRQQVGYITYITVYYSYITVYIKHARHRGGGSGVQTKPPFERMMFNFNLNLFE